MNATDEIRARQLRLAVICNVFGQGYITEEEAKSLLAGPLSPGDDSTIRDDSHLLNVPDALERIQHEVENR